MELIAIDHACRTLCCFFVQLKGVNAFSNVTRLLSNFFKGSSFCLINTLSAGGHRFQAMREIEIWSIIDEIFISDTAVRLGVKLLGRNLQHLKPTNYKTL